MKKSVPVEIVGDEGQLESEFERIGRVVGEEFDRTVSFYVRHGRGVRLGRLWITWLPKRCKQVDREARDAS